MRNLLSTLALLTLAATGSADDWPQWMGPGRDNVWPEKGIVDTLPKEPKVRWRAKVAAGYSGPAVVGGLVYITDFVTADDVTKDNFERKGTAGKERVHCLDVKTGDVKWTKEYPCTYSVSYPNGPRCTPTVSGGKVYTLGAEGNLLCLDAKTGEIKWQKDLKKEYAQKTPLWGFAGHPLIDGDRLICLVGGEGSVAVAFNKDTGAELWKALSAKEPGYSPPTILDVAGKKQLVVWHPESINGLDASSGKVLWTLKQETVNGTSIMSPRAAGDQIFIAAWQKKGQLLKLDGDKASTVHKGTRDTYLYPINSTPFVEDGYIYGVDTEGQLRCVRLKDGERLWETFAPVAGKEAGSGTAHLVKNGDRFFLFAETGDLVLAKLSPKEYVEIGRTHLVNPTSKAFGRDVAWSAPAFADGCVLARNDRELVCVDLKK